MNITIEKGIPMPILQRGTEVTRILRKMEIGDSIVVPFDKAGAWRTAAYRQGITITLRKIDATQFRLWRTK